MSLLESDQARWAEECCKGGNCPICNGRGYRLVENGPDDTDKEICECEEEENGTRTNEVPEQE